MKRIANCALALILALVLAVPAWALDEWDMPADEYVFYSQLSEYGRSIYEEMCKPESLACFRSGESFTMRFNGPFDDFNAASQTIFAASSAALSAFELNHPNLFWLKGSSDGTSGNTGRIDLTVTPHFAENWSSGGRSTASDEAAVTAVVQQIAAEASVQGGPYQQLLYAHDWLTKHNIYNGTAAAADAAGDYLPWTPLSALTDGLSPVCEGYAKAFQLICGELGYPCIMVDGLANGAGHSWNQVQIAGQWYAVDVTYDDPTVSGIGSPDSGYETRDHFLVGADTVVDGTHRFADTHIPDGQRIAGVYFTIPALASQGLDPAFTWGPPDIDEPGTDEPEPIRFADVDDTAYFAPAVQWAVAMGVTKGTGKDAGGSDLFSPLATVTRGQAVTFLYRAMWEPETASAETPFTDVNANDYYYKAVLWAIENGITNGTGADTFSPDDPVTRGQMLTFLCRTINGPAENAEGPWYAPAERWAAENGIAEGTAEAYTTGGQCPRCDVVYYLFHAILSMAG